MLEKRIFIHPIFFFFMCFACSSGRWRLLSEVEGASLSSANLKRSPASQISVHCFMFLSHDSASHHLFPLRMSCRRQYFSSRNTKSRQAIFRRFIVVSNFRSGTLQNFFIGKHIGQRNPQHLLMNPHAYNLLNRATFEIQLSTSQRKTDKILHFVIRTPSMIYGTTI